MDLSTFIQRLENFKSTFSAKMKSYVVNDLAIDLTQMIDNRVSNKGETADGGLFTPYSPGYLAWKKSKGRLSAGNKKNFQLTGRMWSGFGKTAESGDNNNITFVLGGKTSESQQKIDENSERENRSIIEPSKDEIKQLEKNLQKKIEKELQNLVNG